MKNKDNFLIGNEIIELAISGAYENSTTESNDDACEVIRQQTGMPDKAMEMRRKGVQEGFLDENFYPDKGCCIWKCLVLGGLCGGSYRERTADLEAGRIGDKLKQAGRGNCSRLAYFSFLRLFN